MRLPKCTWWRSPRFNALQLCLVVAVIAVAALALHVAERARFNAQRAAWPALTYPSISAAKEAARLKERYGPDRYSRNEEEWVIRDYFQDRKGGYFVDVGANHYKSDSNTYYLESRLGWSGIAIDPQADFAADYRRYRPRSKFFSFFVGDVSDANVSLYLAEGNALVASSTRAFAERDGMDLPNAVRETKEVKVPTIRLTDLLDRVRGPHVDLLSIDVELAEPAVLAGFDIERFAPSLVCIEAHPDVRQQILDYFAAHRYVVLGRYLRADIQNLYFAPLSEADAGTRR